VLSFLSILLLLIPVFGSTIVEGAISLNSFKSTDGGGAGGTIAPTKLYALLSVSA